MTAPPTAPPEEAPTGTGSRGTRVLGTGALAGLAALVLFALVLSPADQDQGDAVRLMYVHVPSAWLAYLAFTVTAVGSVAYLWKRSQWWDLVAAASAEIGVLFTALTLVTGMVWGRATWGVFWTWDARLTTTALLLLLFLGYLAVRRLAAEPEVRSKRAAVVGIVAFLDVPIVHQSVEWWRTLHQEPTLLRRDLNPQIDDLMLFTLVLGVVAFTAVYLWLMAHRFRVAYLEERLASSGLEQALRERREEAGLVS